MRYGDVEVGGEYLTRDVTVNGVLRPYRTRGHVRVLCRQGDGRFQVMWLMKDGTERKAKGLPRLLRPRDLWTVV